MLGFANPAFQVSTFVSAWVDHSPAAARAAANIVVGRWRLFDEPAARAWINSLPPNELPIATKGFNQQPQ